MQGDAMNRIVRGWEFLLGLLLLLAACHSSASLTSTPQTQATSIPARSSEDPNDKIQREEDIVTISFACNGCRPEILEGHAFLELITQFEMLNPDIRIELVSTEDILDSPNSEQGPVVLTHQLLSQVDTALWEPTLEATRQSLLMNLGDFIDADTSFDIDDFYPGMLEHSQWDGGTWAVPGEGDLWVIFYNRDLFDAAGTPYPQCGWTWEEFLATANHLTIQEGNHIVQYGFVNLSPHHYLFKGLSEYRGYRPSESLQNLDLMHPLSVEIVKQYTDLASGGSSLLEEVQTYDGEAEQSRRAFDLCVNGQAAMWLDRVSSYSLLGYTPLSQTQISMVTLPFGDDPTSYLSADRFVMSKGTLHPEESWRWLRFLTYQVLRNPRVRLPARQSVAQDVRYWERWEDRERDTINYALKHAHASSEWISDNYYKAAIDAVLNGQSVEEALSEAQVQVMHMASVRESAPPLPPLSMVETGSVVEPGGIQITFAAMDLYTARYRQLADEFNAIQSDVYVEIEPITHRNTADCFTSLKYEDKTQINLEPLIQSDQTFSFDNVPSALWAWFRKPGS